MICLTEIGPRSPARAPLFPSGDAGIRNSAGFALDSKEVLEARLFRLSDLPAGMPEAHRELAAGL